MNISKYIPAHTRKPLYGVFAVVGVVIGAVQVGYASVGIENPQWLLVTLAVFPFVAGAVGFTAQAATEPTSTEGVGEDTDIPDEIERESDEVEGPEGPGQDEEVLPEEDPEFDDPDAGEDEIEYEPDELEGEDDPEPDEIEYDETPPPPGYEPRH